MSLPAWDGGKDKGAFRTLSDVAGGTDGIRTVTQTQGDTTTTLRTRAGNPEMTIRKKGGPRVVLEEVKYSARKYWRDKDEDQDQKFDDEMQTEAFRNDKTISRFFFVLKKILFSVGILKLKEPDTSKEIEVDAVAPDDDKDNHWLKFRYSSDGILAIPQLSPKTWSIGGNNVRFKKLERYPASATLLELKESAPKTAKRSFYDYQLMRANPRNWIYAIVKPVHTVECLCNGQPNKVFFKKPKLDEGVDWHGVNALPTHSMDHVRVFGQPWHGTQDMSGVLTMASGNTKAGFRPGYYFDPTSVHPSFAGWNTAPSRSRYLKITCVDFDMQLPPARDESETEAGLSADAEFKSYAYLNGPRRQMSPVDDSEYRKYSTLPSSSWLYKCPDGAVWCLYTSYAAGANFGLGLTETVRIRGINLNRKYSEGDAIFNALYQAPSSGVIVYESGDLGSISDWPFDELRNDATTSSKDGKRAHINTGAWVGPWGLYAASFVLTVSGGGLDELPTITHEYHDGRHGDLGNVGPMNPDWPDGGVATDPTNITQYVGGFMAYDGVFKKVTESVDLTYTPFDPATLDIQPGHSWDGGTRPVTYRKTTVKVLINAVEIYKSVEELTQTFGLVDGNGALTSQIKSFTSTFDGVVGLFRNTTMFTAGRFDENGFAEIHLDSVDSEGAYTGTPRKFAYNLHSNKRLDLGTIADADYIGFDPKTDEFLINKWPW